MRYIQYDQMDQDLEINAALDTIAEFGTQEDDSTGLPMMLDYDGIPSDTEQKILVKTLTQWCNLNQLHKRAFRIFRNSIKYGDQFFIRDPETFELYWVDPANIEKVIVNTIDMYGSVRGIAGNAVQAVKALELESDDFDELTSDEEN
jgi:hypothetical protein